MMCHHYLELLEDVAEIVDFCDRIFEFTELLVHSLYLNFIDKGQPERVALHTSCAARREMGMHITGNKLLSQLKNVELIMHNYESGCCGFAGDKGFTTPELNENAPLKAQVPKNCNSGYSNSRTCEIGLSHHAGIDYQSIVYLVDKATIASEVI